MCDASDLNHKALPRITDIIREKLIITTIDIENQLKNDIFSNFF